VCHRQAPANRITIRVLMVVLRRQDISVCEFQRKAARYSDLIPATVPI
jgi:hypothetical protein